jgi:leader peptidase (prepilin peptidase)/N-methyltransferase
MTCNRNLRWYELIPVFSFLIQSGKCRRCASKISHQYPIVELITGIMFTLVAFKFLSVLDASYWTYVFLVVLYVFIFSLLIVISVYDLRHKIIPDRLVYAFIFISFFSIFINYSGIGPLFTYPTLINLISGPVIAIPFVLLWFFSKGKLMGLGDGKLILGIGWIMGLYAGLSAVILSFWIGTVVSLVLMFLSKRKMNMKTEIPFAPFLIISMFVTFLFSLDIFSLSKIFSI